MIDMISVIETIMVAIAVAINSCILYYIIRDHIRVIKIEKSIKCSKRYEWLYKAGLIETSMFFNEWGFEQVRQFGYPYE